MLTPELSRLNCAPSTCVCSVGHRNEKAIMGDVIRARHEIKPDILKARRFQSRPASHVHARPKSKSRQSQISLRGNRKSETFASVETRDNRGPEGAADERARKPGSTAGKGCHRLQPLVPEVGPGGTSCAVELLTQEAETSLILRRPRAAKVTP